MEEFAFKDSTRKRKSNEQLEFFLNYCEENPYLLTNKFHPKFPNLINELWEEVSNSLNSMTGPTKTPKQWKESLMHWRNQIKSCARKSMADKKITGGGPPTKDTLTIFENRALQIFGNISVNGIQNVPVLGFGITNENSKKEDSLASTQNYTAISNNENVVLLLSDIITVSPTIEEKGTQTILRNNDGFKTAMNCIVLLRGHQSQMKILQKN